MTAVWLAVRSRLRSGWRSALALVLLVGLGGGIAMAALSGARRTDTALDRFLRYTTVNSAVAYITPPTGNQAYRGVPADEAGRRRLEVQHLAGIRALPEVAWAGRMMPVIMATERPGRPGWHVTLGYVPLDGSPESTYGRPIVVSGRLPDADRADEVAVNEELASRAGLRLGSRLPVGVYGSDQFGLVGNGAPLVPGGVHRSLRVVGVVRYPPDVLPTVLERNDFASDHSVMWLTPAFGAAMGADVANYGVGVMLRLRPGPVDLPHLQRAVAGVVGSDQVDVQRNVLVGFNVGAVADIGKATDVETLALVGFSVLTALATALLLWQALRRQLSLEGTESPTLAALGMTERELVWTTTISAVWIGTAGAVVAAATALALSPLLPIGVARRMEVDLGLHVDRAGAARRRGRALRPRRRGRSAHRPAPGPRRSEPRRTPARERLPPPVGTGPAARRRRAAGHRGDRHPDGPPARAGPDRHPGGDAPDRRRGGRRRGHGLHRLLGQPLRAAPRPRALRRDGGRRRRQLRGGGQLR